jgi:iron complex outermembrane recepter protein
MAIAARIWINARSPRVVTFFALLGLCVAGKTANAQVDEEDWIPARPASMLMQPTPLLEPRINVAEDSRTAESGAAASRLRSTTGNANSANRAAAEAITFTSKDVLSGRESLTLSSTDLGSLLKKSSSGLSSSVQSKTPIVSDPRIRGSRIGALAASGSHWVPARTDLDTILSKFDSRQIKSVEIIPGPYSSKYGPGFSFTDVQLLGSPRYANGPEWHGSSDAEYKVNGNQFFGQQTLLAGASDWGARFNYAAREGDDYRAGGRLAIPSSYQSQEMILALGRDWKEDSIEINVLRLDQTDVVFPGYVFDIDYLVTDGYEATHTSRDRGGLDSIETEAWYNRTRFEGNAQNQRKRPFFPVLGLINYTGVTDVDSMSTGYRQSFNIGDLDSEAFQFTFGHDLRFVKQELNEISSGVTLGLPIPFANRNAPIPRSYIANPGLFTEYREALGEKVEVRMGARADYATSDIVNDPANIAVGLDSFPASYSNIVGTNAYQRDFALGSCFASVRYDPTDTWTTSVSGGYAERAPTLTELYAAQPFMLLLQNGLNNVTGDPTLAKEKLFQLDLGAEYHDDWLKTGGRVFHSWGIDYITFENTQVNTVPPNGDVGQVSLRYVNTDLATILGGEWFGELVPNGPVTPFANLRVVDGRDRTRNGNFATTNGDAFNASQKVAGQARGAFNQGQIATSNAEPLPSMPPLELRIGLRLHDTSPQKIWTVDLSSRTVSRQDRVATSLLETPTGGFTTWDMRGVFRVPKVRGLVVALGVENMFDRLYREHFDFRTANGLSIFQPGANFYLSSSLSY